MKQQTITRDSTALRQTIRSEFETSHANFLRLLETLSETDWKRKSANRAWDVGELMGHMTQYLDVALPMLVQNARKGKAMRLPKALANRINVMMARSYARKLSRQTIAQRYETAQRAALALLDGVKDEEWGLSTCFPDGERITIEGLFRRPAQHFEEHAQQVRLGLRRES